MIGVSRIRTHEWPVTLKGVQTLHDSGTLISSTPKETTMWNFGKCADRTNPVGLIGKTNLDIGGPFSSYQARMEYPIVGNEMIGKFAGLVYAYKGPIIASPAYVPTTWQPPSWWSMEGVASSDGGPDSIATRFGLGATAISRCKPASPEASLGVFLMETYREGIPRLLSNFKDVQGEVDFFRSLGSNYLNVEFGWKPFVSDLRKTARAVEKSQQILEDLRRHSGKRMRRRYVFPETVVTSVLNQDNVLPYQTGLPYSGTAQSGRKITLYTSRKTWFEGEFVYSFPQANSGIPKKVLAGSRQILGLDLTPETLWNIAPWTWLFDWFGNIGDVMSNVSAIGSDNLVMRYGYLMQEVERRYLTVHSNVRTNYVPLPPTITGAAIYSGKTRIGASPYGFGPTFDNFTPRQVAILTAIGITRRSPA